MDDPSKNNPQNNTTNDAPVQDVADSDAVVESTPQQIFDITSDLNINPVKPGQEEESPEIKPIPKAAIPKTALQNEIASALGSKFKMDLEPDIPKPTPTPPVVTVTNVISDIPKSMRDVPPVAIPTPAASPNSSNTKPAPATADSSIPLSQPKEPFEPIKSIQPLEPIQSAPPVVPTPVPLPPTPAPPTTTAPIPTAPSTLPTAPAESAPIPSVQTTQTSPTPPLPEFIQTVNPIPSTPSVPIDKPEEPRFNPMNPPTKTLGSVENSTRRVPQIDKANAAPIKSIKTFEGDVAETLSHTRASTTSIAIAESVKKTGEARLSNMTVPPTRSSTTDQTRGPSTAPRNIFFATVSFALILGGAFGGYYLYSISPLAPSKTPPLPTQPATAAALIKIDSQVAIEIDGKSPNTVLSLIEKEIAKDQKPNTIKEIVMTIDDESGRVRVGAKDMADLMKIPAPDVLKRSLNTPWMLGVYSNTNGEKSVFIIATNNYFQNSFAGMIQWERLMADDIKKYLYVPPLVTGAVTASVSGTSTSSTSEQDTLTSAPARENSAYITIRGAFEDRIVGNKDVREFITTDRGLLFLYSFISNDKLLITDKESTLIEILVRIEKQSFMR